MRSASTAGSHGRYAIMAQARIPQIPGAGSRRRKGRADTHSRLKVFQIGMCEIQCDGRPVSTMRIARAVVYFAGRTC